MLTDHLGYRSPSRRERAKYAYQRAMLALKNGRNRELPPCIPAAVISREPLVSYSGIVPGAPLGVASLVSKPAGFPAAWFLLSPTWSLEADGAAKMVRHSAILHRRSIPQHKLIFMCNSRTETALMHELGEPAFFHNKTSSVPEWIFKPLDTVAVKYDAVYNAQLAHWKRHELSLGIGSCAFIYYRGAVNSSTVEAEQALLARHASLAPGHVFINKIDKDREPIRLRPQEVNYHLNEAAVGLCLSGEEGAMFASTEYLLAGLPVVSTRSRGGRDLYYDKEYCIIVPPDPRSVAEAVAALKAKEIPRNYIRRKTLESLQRERNRFLDLLNAIFEESGCEHRLAEPWPFERQVIMDWLDPAVAIGRVLSGTVDAFCDIEAGEPADQTPGNR